jgi:cell division protein FtsQ
MRRVPILIGLAALVIAVAVWLVAFSPMLGARTVTVTGVRTLTVAQVRAAAGIGHNEPLIRLNTAAVRHRLESIPDVADAQISVRYPSTVLITVTERIPVGYLAGAQGGFVLVDSSGTEYRQVTKVPAALPHFVLPGGAGANSAQSLAAGHAVATVAAALSPSVLAKLAEIRATDADSIMLLLRDGRTVQWGSAAQSAQKARLLPALLTQHATSFDLSNPDLVVAR